MRVRSVNSGRHYRKKRNRRMKCWINWMWVQQSLLAPERLRLLEDFLRSQGYY